MLHAFASLKELHASLDERTPYTSVDSLSGSHFEAVRFQGEPMILKYVCVDDDWIMRATGDLGCRQLTMLESGLLDRLPAEIDNPTVGVAPYRSARGHRGAAILMRDVAGAMIPPGSTAIDVDTHLQFLEHMAAMHAAYWGWRDDLGLLPLAHHYVILTPTMASIEAELGSSDPVPAAVAEGWSSLHTLWPDTAATLEAVAHEPGALTSALAGTPQTLVHGDWKLGNLGAGPDGRTVLLDWDRCGAAPATLDLAWYLAVNCDRLPQSKEAAIDAYRACLEARSISTSGWWERQLTLTLLGGFLQLCWAKTEDPAEFGWWNDRLAAGLSLL